MKTYEHTLTLPDGSQATAELPWPSLEEAQRLPENERMDVVRAIARLIGSATTPIAPITPSRRPAPRLTLLQGGLKDDDDRE